MKIQETLGGLSIIKERGFFDVDIFEGCIMVTVANDAAQSLKITKYEAQRLIKFLEANIDHVAD